jgi:hypothetical protein
MPYILIMLFLAATGPTRLDHVNSIRFDSEQACKAAMVSFRSHAILAANGADLLVTLDCIPAK